jgi:transcriptional regulator with XRE-family HTH domain
MRNGISYWRKKRQLSRNKLAAAIGTTPLAIEKLEKGVLQLSINTLAR